MKENSETSKVPEALKSDKTSIKGHLTLERFDKDGNLLERFEGNNLVTQVGDQVYGERGGGVTGAPAAPTGMKLGTGSTAVAKTGSGAALTTYLSGSNKAFDATYPLSAVKLAATAPTTTYDARKITYKRTYAAGEGTSASPITEAVIVNDTISTDATSTAANTISRMIVSGISAKASTDSIVATWDHIIGGG